MIGPWRVLHGKRSISTGIHAIAFNYSLLTHRVHVNYDRLRSLSLLYFMSLQLFLQSTRFLYCDSIFAFRLFCTFSKFKTLREYSKVEEIVKVYRELSSVNIVMGGLGIRRGWRLPGIDDNNFLNFPPIVGKRCNLFNNYSGFRSI